MTEILKLLQAGCQISFKAGYILEGFPKDKEIKGYYIDDTGPVLHSAWELTLRGTDKALNYAESFES